MLTKNKSLIGFCLFLAFNMLFCTKNKALDELKESFDSNWTKLKTFDEIPIYPVISIGDNALLFSNYQGAYVTDSSFNLLKKLLTVSELDVNSYQNINAKNDVFFRVGNYLYATNSTKGVNLNNYIKNFNQILINNTSQQLLAYHGDAPSSSASTNFKLFNLSISNKEVQLIELKSLQIPINTQLIKITQADDLFFVSDNNNLWRIKDTVVTKVWTKGGCREMAKMNDTLWTISANSQFLYSVDNGQTFNPKIISEFINVDFTSMFFSNNYLIFNGYYYKNFQNKKKIPTFLGYNISSFVHADKRYIYTLRGINEGLVNWTYGDYIGPRSTEVWQSPL